MTDPEWQTQRDLERASFTPTEECRSCQARVPVNGMVGTREGGFICIPCAVGAQAASEHDETGGTHG